MGVGAGGEAADTRVNYRCVWVLTSKALAVFPGPSSCFSRCRGVFPYVNLSPSSRAHSWPQPLGATSQPALGQVRGPRVGAAERAEVRPVSLALGWEEQETRRVVRVWGGLVSAQRSPSPLSPRPTPPSPKPQEVPMGLRTHSDLLPGPSSAHPIHLRKFVRASLPGKETGRQCCEMFLVYQMSQCLSSPRHHKLFMIFRDDILETRETGL